MADKQLHDTTENVPPAADSPGNENQVLVSEESQPIELPERIRVHALAKLLGVTSKKLLERLRDLGTEARSPQSSVDREAAVAAAAALGVPVTTSKPAESAAPPDKPAPVEGAPAVEYQSLFASHAAEPAQAPVEAPADVAPPVFLPPAVESTPRRRPPRKKAAPAVTAAEVAPEADTAKKTEAPAEAVAEVKTGPTETEAPADARPTEDAPTEDGAAEDGADDTRSDGGNRRRRRGRRGRGRGRGEQAANEGEDAPDDEQATAESAEPAPAAEAETTAEAEAGDNADDTGDDSDESNPNRRRRRRRRRKSGGESSGDDSASTEDDPPNTVVHEREPRNKTRPPRDEVQGISGSTRLEAKRQRRRDGRDAGRRRPPILSESEFLARREAVDRVMVVREKTFPGHPMTTQVAVLEDKVLVEHFVTTDAASSMVGNVYLGKVQNVLPSMEAAFVDIGKGRNGVLYAGEVNWEAAGLGGRERKIEQALKPGDKVLVQVSKDPVGHKGARLTTQISFAGRFLVYVPGGSSTGISRKLPDTERKRLKEILREVLPEDAGVIIRTASEGVSADELAGDVARLKDQWRQIEEQVDAAGPELPKTLYEEPDLLVKVIRDLFNEDFTKLVIEGDKAWNVVETYVSKVAPDLMPRLERYERNSNIDVFNAHRIDEQIAKALDRKVWLPSGGTLVIDRTEAMTVVDVNTGKFTGTGGNLEETVTRNNLEAAEEIVRQMRLRDIGGIIIVDFIDMVLESNRDLVLRRLTECLARDRTRHQVSEVTSLGLVQMTRKKLGTGLVEAFSTTCDHCHGRGLLVSDIPIETAQESKGGDRDQQPRRKRSREKQAPPPEVVEPTPDADLTVRRAHPVALAMAAHHDHGDGDTAEAAEAAAPEESAVPDVGAPVEPVATPASEAPTPESEAAVAVPTAEPEPAAKEAGPAASAGRPRSRRRVSRVTAAAASADTGDGFVFSAPAVAEPTAAEPPVAQAVAVESAPVAVPPRQRPRRRAAGRPAGPPQDGDES